MLKEELAGNIIGFVHSRLDNKMAKRLLNDEEKRKEILRNEFPRYNQLDPRDKDLLISHFRHELKDFLTD